MKPVVTFALGAALASGVVYYTVHRDTPEPPKQAQVAAPAPAAPAPVEVQPVAPVSTPAPAPVQSRISKPSSMARTAPVHKPEHREIAQSSRPSPVAEPTPPAAQTAPTPSQPATPAATTLSQIPFPGPPPEEHRAPEPRKPQVATIPPARR
jgi:hypothetical protein